MHEKVPNAMKNALFKTLADTPIRFDVCLDKEQALQNLKAYLNCQNHQIKTRGWDFENKSFKTSDLGEQ